MAMERWTVDTEISPPAENDIWDEIISAEHRVDDFFRIRNTGGEMASELPGVAARLDHYFIPPLPWRLFRVLATLPGKAWVLYLVLWRLARIRKTTSLTVTSTALRGLRMNRHQKTRGLQALETAGLLTVKRSLGRNPQVTMRPLHELFPRRD